IRTRSLVPARRAVSASMSGSLVSASSSTGASTTSMPSSASTRTTPSSASPVSSARSTAVVTSPIVTNPRERPSATRSVICCVSDGPLVTTVRLTRPVCPSSPPLRGAQFYYSDLRFNLLAMCVRTPGNVSRARRYAPVAPPLGPGRTVQEPLAALLEPHEFTEQPAVARLVFRRVHPLQPRLDRGDLPPDGELADPGEDHVRVLLVRLARDLERIRRQLGDECPRPVIGRGLKQCHRPVPGPPGGAHAAGGGDHLEHGGVLRHAERRGAERVELRPGQRRPLHRELERLPLHPQHRVGAV